MTEFGVLPRTSPLWAKIKKSAKRLATFGAEGRRSLEAFDKRARSRALPKFLRHDLTGQRFGLLTALRPTDRASGRGHVLWLCRCNCGNEIAVRAGSLRDGNTRSCGCLRASASGERMREAARDDTGRLLASPVGLPVASGQGGGDG